MKWLVTYDFENENHEKSETLVLYQDSKMFKMFNSRMDVYFVAVTTVKDIVLIVQIYFT